MLVGLLVAGVVFRSWGVITGTLDFWADEAWWAVNVVEQSLFEPSIRPVGYVWLHKNLAAVGHPELFLRLPSFLAGIGTMACITGAAWLLIRNRAVVLFVAFVATLHPELIAFSKEFKPYSLEAFIHSGLTVWALACWQKRRTSAAFWIATVLALPFCYNVVFLYPALLLALAPRLVAWSGLPRLAQAARSMDRRLVLALIIVTVLGCLSMARLFEPERKIFWGMKYGVFPIELGVLETLAWYGRETWMLVTQPAALRGIDPALQVYFRPLLTIAYVAGIASLAYRRRFAELGLLASPVAFVALANVLGFWPYGDFRTNLFLLPGSLLVMGVGLLELTGHRVARPAAYAGMLAVALAALPADVGKYRWKWMRDGTPGPQLSEVLDEVMARQRLGGRAGRNVILADWHSWRVLHYYLEYHPEGRVRYAPIRESTRLVRGPLNGLPLLESMLQEEYRLALEHGGITRVWIVVTKLDQFSGIHASPLAMEFQVHEKAFATHDRLYHPELIEVRFEAPAAIAGDAGDGGQGS